MTRIAHIANLYGPKSGGLRTTMDELSAEYARQGNSVLLVVPGKKYSSESTGLVTRIIIAAPIIPFSGGYRIILKTNAVIEQLEKFDPDVIEISDRTTLLRVARWAGRHDLPTTFFAHERVDGVVKSFAGFLPFQKSLVRQWNRITRDSVGRIVATTNFAAQEFLQLGLKVEREAGSKLVSVPLGVNLEKFDSNHSRLVIEDIELPENYILACTRLSKEKDPFFLLEIAREIRNRKLGIPLLIAGSGPLEKKMLSVIESEGLDVSLLGFITEKGSLSRIMAGATSFLAVGPIETFGLAALETLASGTPVICRAEAAISEIISADSGRALPRSAGQWVDAITDFELEDRDEVRSFARKRAEEFTWQETADQLLNFYRWDIAS
jgi:alpha-1,6-mannosyltransferase